MKINSKRLKVSLLISAIVSSATLVGCGDSKQDTPPLTRYDGVWQQQGNPEVWQFNNNELARYSVNTYGCIRFSNEKYTDLDGLEKHLTLNSGTLSLNNDATNTWRFSKLSALPEACNAQNQLDAASPIDNFEFFWHHFNDNYAFFELRDLDWQAIYTQYRPAITAQTTPAQLEQILADIISRFDDSHVSLTATTDDYSGTGGLKGLPLEALRYLVLNGETDIDERIETVYEQMVTARGSLITRYINDPELTTQGETGAVSWGLMGDNIGYLKISKEHQMLKPLPESGTILELLNNAAQDYADTDEVMQAAMNALQDTEVLIIDLRLNEGGYDKVSQKIASYFNDQEKVFGRKQLTSLDGTITDVDLTVGSVAAPYTKPIYVISGQSNVSAGEVLTMALTSLDHVTLIGQPSNGSVSDSLDFTLPNGWQASLSNQVYTDASGHVIEGSGVTPDELVPVYAIEDFEYESDNAIDAVLQKLNQPLPFAITEPQLDALIEKTRQELTIPGLSIAVVHDGEIVFENGYGEKALGTGVAVTENTPFNVGSISKAVLGTAIMQKLEQQQINLDTPVNDLDLPFTVGHPDATEAITLRHLVTHTSGIADTAAYNCNYYIHGTDLSLFAAFGASHCPQHAIVDPTAFYQAYFAPGSEINPELPYYSVEPGQFHSYSNVGAGLAAYAIESHLNIDFSEDMITTLFAPLGMANTRWKHTDLSPQNAKATQYTMDQNNEALEVPEYSYPTFYDGDLNTSAHDLARLMLAISAGGELNNSRILSASSIGEMLSNQTGLDDFASERQGLFWFRSGAFIGHTGGDPGTSATMQYNPTTQTGIVFMMNIEDDHLGKEELGERLSPLISALYQFGVSQ